MTNSRFCKCLLFLFVGIYLTDMLLQSQRKRFLCIFFYKSTCTATEVYTILVKLRVDILKTMGA